MDFDFPNAFFTTLLRRANVRSGSFKGFRRTQESWNVDDAMEGVLNGGREGVFFVVAFRPGDATQRPAQMHQAGHFATLYPIQDTVIEAARVVRKRAGPQGEDLEVSLSRDDWRLKGV